MAFGGTAPSSRITLAQLALLLSSMLVAVHSFPMEAGTRFVIHVPHTIEHIHHHHTEEIFVPAVHHKKPALKEWIVVEEDPGHQGQVTHTALPHNGFRLTPAKYQFGFSDGKFAVTPGMTQVGLGDPGLNTTPGGAQVDFEESGYTTDPEKSLPGLADSEFSISPEENQADLADSGFNKTPQKAQTAMTGGGLTLTPQKWPTQTSIPRRNPFSGRHFGRALGGHLPMISYKPMSVSAATQTAIGGDAKGEDAGYRIKEEVEDITTPSPPGFKPQVITNVQTQQQKSAELLQQIKPNLDYEPNLQLQYQTNLQPKISLEPQVKVQTPLHSTDMSYVPEQLVSYRIMDHQGNPFNRLTLHNKREVKYKVHAPVFEPKNVALRGRVPIRIPHSAMMAGLRLSSYRPPHLKTIVRVPEGIKPQKVSKHQGLKEGERIRNGYDAVASESKPVARIPTQANKMLLKVGNKKAITEKVLETQRHPGRSSSGGTSETKLEVSMSTETMPNTGVKIPEAVSVTYTEAGRTSSDKTTSGPKMPAQISSQSGRPVPRVESNLKTQNTATTSHLGTSAGRMEAERSSNRQESVPSESKTELSQNSQDAKMALNVNSNSKLQEAQKLLEPESVTQTIQEFPPTSKVKSKITHEDKEVPGSPKELSAGWSPVFYPSIGPFGNSEPMDISLRHHQLSASSKVTEVDKNTAAATQSA